MGKHKTYSIRLITDILKIPVENFPEFIDDLVTYYNLFKPAELARKGIPIGEMKFTPDGKRKYRIHIKNPQTNPSGKEPK